MKRTGSAATIDRALARLGSSVSITPDGRRLDADQVLRAVEPVARRTCRAVLSGWTDDRIDDVVQRVLEITWTKLPGFVPSPTGDSQEGLDRWVKQIARNVCANARRARVDLLTEDGVLDGEDPARSALAGLRRQEREELLRGAIEEALEGLEQDVLYHRYVHGLDRGRIAELLELQDSEAVRVVLYRASRKLRRALERRVAALGHGESLLRDSDG